jgi:hypothetical protein
MHVWRCVHRDGCMVGIGYELNDDGYLYGFWFVAGIFLVSFRCVRGMATAISMIPDT